MLSEQPLPSQFTDQDAADSPNTHDSLGEAYMKADRKKPAIEHYERSLVLNPQNTNAGKMLEQLRSRD